MEEFKVPTFEEHLNEAKLTPAQNVVDNNYEEFFIFTHNFQGDIGQFYKGEVVEISPSEENPKEYIFVNGVSDTSEIYSDIYYEDFENVLRPVTKKDTKAMKLLNKLGKLESGNAYFTIYISPDSKDSLHDEITQRLNTKNPSIYSIARVVGDSPKLAIKNEYDGKLGKVEDVGRDVYFIRTYAGEGFLVSAKDDLAQWSVSKIKKFVLKSDAMKKYV